MPRLSGDLAAEEELSDFGSQVHGCHQVTHWFCLTVSMMNQERSLLIERFQVN